MPLLFRGACVWVAGTALGLRGEVSGVVIGASVAAALWFVWRGLGESRAHESSRIEGLLALALLFSTGLVLGNDLRRADAQCSAEAQTARSWDLTLRGDAEPGSFTMAGMSGNGCQLRVALAVRSGSAAAGSVVRVTRAEPSLGDRGLMLRDGVVELKRAPSLLGRWRNHVARAIDARFGADAGLARALLIADTHGLSPELRERYTDAGLVHILSISGLHVGIIGGALLLLVEALRLPVTMGRLGAVALVMLYVLAIGAPAAAMRSAALFASVALTRVLQRPTSVWATFSIGALVPLIEPRTVLDLGWQLSVAGYAGVLAAGRAARRLLPDKWRGWRGTIARELIAGVLTTTATAPLVAWHFGRLSLVAIVSNLGAAPVVAVLQPTLFLAMLVPGDLLGRFVADAARPLMRALDAVAAAAASVPFAAVSVAPTMIAACVAAVGVVAVMTAAWSRHWRPWATLALSCVALLAWAPAPRLAHDGQLEVHLLDVGQGDAVALRTPSGRWVIIDAGREWKSGDAGRATVVPYVRRQGGALALFVLTHPHADHVGGAASVIRALRPARVRDAAFVAGSPAYAAMLTAARDVRAEWARVTPGEQLEIDGVRFTFLAPDSAWTVALNDPNEASTIVRVDYGERSFLFTGDAEHQLEDWLLHHAAENLNVDVLKAGHHGSITSSGEAFVDAVTPRIALVSVGVGNTYGHPSQEVMTRLREAGAAVLRTDQLGTVIVRTDGQSLEVQAAGHRWTPKPLPD